MRDFSDCDERDVLALAISSEEEDSRIYADFAAGLRERYPDTATVFAAMAAQEDGHRRALIEQYRRRFGEHIPYIARRHVRGAPVPPEAASVMRRGIAAVREQVARMEAASARFYQEAIPRSTEAGTRKLLGDLAAAERQHERIGRELAAEALPAAALAREDEAERRRFVLQVVQPGLVGLMDGSVSTLAPVFAAAFATGRPWDAFLVGMAASVGAGISMGFAEALADDGRLSGRGAPLLRGLVCGLMTMAGGVGHTLPFLIGDFRLAVAVSATVVVVELGLIAWIQWRFMETPPLTAAPDVVLGGARVGGVAGGLIAWTLGRFLATPPPAAAAKVVLGGALVLAAGVLIGGG
ncbi:rubrerythrin [Roseomonas sp. NAR14]|uniref:Rubrerythrin n=1 Tax=Roseomonas acroporae TaxID=2937791 RepID=A0A9X1YAW0_9PROT|nr:ferritin family protein [Roseomonas acroporae]MCK8787369.1 rubrerythrin [Roseomonas acroporae]